MRRVVSGDERRVAHLSRPAVDDERHKRLVGRGQPPLEHTDRRADGEGPCRVAEAQALVAGVELLVDVRVGLELKPWVGAHLQRHDRLARVRIGVEKLQDAVHLERLQTAVARHGHRKLLLS